MKTTNTDDANLAEIAELLADIETTNRDLKSKIYRPSSPTVSWIPFLVVAAIAATAGLWAGMLLTGAT